MDPIFGGKMPLTDAQIKTAKARNKPYRLYDRDSLYLEITPAGGKYWRLKYRIKAFDKNGEDYRLRERRHTLGKYPGVTLKRARGLATEVRTLIGKGVDPAARKKSEAEPKSFLAVAREWRSLHEPKWSASHASRVKKWIETDLAPIGRTAIRDVGAQDLLKALRAIEARGAISSAHRVKQVAGQIFRYGVSTAQCDHDIAAALKGALQPEPSTEHLAAITDPKELGGLLRMLDDYQGTHVVRAALRIAPYVFVRPGELRHMEWSEIDFEKRQWTIPGSKMKTRKDHLVPLCNQVIKVLKDLEPLTGNSTYVFPSMRNNDRPMSDNAVLAAFRRLGIPKDKLTGHGFRATARTLLDEDLRFRVEYIEHQLAHAVRDANGRAYNRTSFIEERRLMMQKWADYLDSLKNG